MALLAILIGMNFIACDSYKKNYKVTFGEGVVNITMRCPTIGVAGWREISFDGFTLADIEEEVFKGIRNRKYLGNYDVYVILQFRDSYGNFYDSQKKVKVSTLNGEDVKKYADFGYFKGKVTIDKAFPWNHNYNNK